VPIGVAITTTMALTIQHPTATTTIPAIPTTTLVSV